MKIKLKVKNENDEQPEGAQVKITQRIELNFWRTSILTSIGLLLAWMICGDKVIHFGNIFYFSLLVVTIWFLNWIIRPVLVLFTLPFIIFTMGVGMLFINALIIYLAAYILPPKEIFVSSYWAALLASFIVSFLSWGLALAQSEKNIRRAWKTKHGGKNNSDDDHNDVIDV